MSGTFPFDLYLERLGLRDRPAPGIDGLASLMKRQAHAIAFENLDVLAGIPIDLDRDAIVDKILVRRRGGYCFELNGLLAAALKAAGFEPRARLARVTFGRDTPAPPSHGVLVVRCDGAEWLVDAGFGGPGLVMPMRLVDGNELDDGRARFRLAATDEGELHLQRFVAGTWKGLYLVAPGDALPSEIRAANSWVSTWERSPFRSRLMCAIPTADGLLTTRGNALVRLDHELEPQEERSLATADDLRRILASAMQVSVDAETARMAWARTTRSLEGGI